MQKGFYQSKSFTIFCYSLWNKNDGHLTNIILFAFSDSIIIVNSKKEKDFMTTFHKIKNIICMTSFMNDPGWFYSDDLWSVMPSMMYFSTKSLFTSSTTFVDVFPVDYKSALHYHLRINSKKKIKDLEKILHPPWRHLWMTSYRG